MADLEEEGCKPVALGSAHFRYQRPPVFPLSFSDDDLRRIGAPTLLLVAGRRPSTMPAGFSSGLGV